MGDTRVRDGIHEHQVAPRGQPENWVRIGYDEAGNPVTAFQSATADVSLTPDGFLVFNFGGHIITAPPSVAAAIVDALSMHVPQGAQTQVAARVAQIEEQIAAKKAEHAQALNDLDNELAAKQAAIAAVETQLAEADAKLQTAQAALNSTPAAGGA